jgi:hypothetical protein
MVFLSKRKDMNIKGGGTVRAGGGKRMMESMIEVHRMCMKRSQQNLWKTVTKKVKKKRYEGVGGKGD